MELPKIEHVRAEIQVEIWLACRRSYCSIDIGRQQAANARALLEADLGGCGTGEHLAAIKGAGSRPDKTIARKHIKREVIAIRPDAKLGIVVEVRLLEGIAVVRPGGVRGGRDGHTLEERRAACHGELTEHPATCRFVILGDDIPIVVGLARSAKPCPQGVACGWSHEQ